MADTTVADLNGLFKQAYADDIINLIPENSIITRNVAFQGRDKMLGDLYHQPVVVATEQGFTYAAPGSGAFNMNPAITMKTQDAQVTGYQLLERAGLDYESVFKAQNVNSFRDAVDLSMEQAMESFGKRLEVGFLYGQSPTGTMGVGSVSGVTSTTTYLVAETGQWAAGIWTGGENAQLDVFNAGGTALNTVGAVSVTSVDNINKKILVTGAAADITAINAGSPAYVRFYGANGNEAAGIDAILLNTGTLFNISATTYALWAANVYDNGSAALTFSGLQKAVSLAVKRGLAEDVEVLVNPDTWVDLLNQQAALRQYDDSFGTAKAVNGSKAIEFWSQNGKMTIYPHIYVKEGEAFIVPFDRCVRIGSTDVTFNIPGTMDGKVFQQQANNAGFEYRIYSQQSFLIETPAKCVKVKNIVN